MFTKKLQRAIMYTVSIKSAVRKGKKNILKYNKNYEDTNNNQMSRRPHLEHWMENETDTETVAP